MSDKPQFRTDEILNESRLGCACARALGVEPFRLEGGDDLAAEVEWVDGLELELARMAGEGTEREYLLAHLVGLLAEAELAADLARAGDDHKWAILRAAGHARRIVELPRRIGAGVPRSPRRK